MDKLTLSIYTLCILPKRNIYFTISNGFCPLMFTVTDKSFTGPDL